QRLRRNRERQPLPGADVGPYPARHLYVSAIVITWFAPRFPQGGGAPSPTRIVITGNGGTFSGHGVRQSVTITSRSIGSTFLSMNARMPTPMPVPPPPYSSTCAAENTSLTSCTAASQHATMTSAPCPSCRGRPPSSATALDSGGSSIELEVSIRTPGRGRG